MTKTERDQLERAIVAAIANGNIVDRSMALEAAVLALLAAR
jgi:hypothetical protein